MIELNVYDGKILMGMNAADNWSLMETMKRSDYWIHMKNTSSSHAIARIPKKFLKSAKTMDMYLEHAARMICQQSSKRIKKDDKKVVFIYIEGKYVKKGNNVGEAILSKDPYEFSIDNPLL